MVDDYDEATFGPACRKAWLFLTARIDAQGNLADVYKSPTVAKYYARKRIVGDFHG